MVVTGCELIAILIQAHGSWMRAADVDGLRVDTARHMGELACSRFCSNVREYADALGKRGFFLFGEVASPHDEIDDRSIGQNTSRQNRRTTVFFGLDSVLDFRLTAGVWADAVNAPLRDIILGLQGPATLLNRLAARPQRALNRGELGRYLVTFIDNHDSFWQPGRIAAAASDEQVIGVIGYLLCALGTPCLYYGTEQGFAGSGGDPAVREAMFDRATPDRNLLNPACVIYQAIAPIAAVVRTSEPLRFGRMYFRLISGDGEHFGYPYGTIYTLAFSRLLHGREVLVAYNVSATARSDYIVVDAVLRRAGDQLVFRYGGVSAVPVRAAADGTHAVQLSLAPHQFVILE